MTKVYTQPKRKSVHIITELEGISADEVTLSGGYFVSGEVLGIAADGKHIKLNLAAGAGDTAVAVLYGNADATNADAKGIAHCRICAVRADKLVWPENITEAKKAEFLAELITLNIIPR